MLFASVPLLLAGERVRHVIAASTFHYQLSSAPSTFQSGLETTAPQESSRPSVPRLDCGGTPLGGVKSYEVLSLCSGQGKSTSQAGKADQIGREKTREVSKKGFRDDGRWKL